jgi:hypothetical protein
VSTKSKAIKKRVVKRKVTKRVKRDKKMRGKILDFRKMGVIKKTPSKGQLVKGK